VEGANAFDDHDAVRTDHPSRRERPLPVPVEPVKACVAFLEQRLQDLSAEPGELETGTVPELVRAHNLGAGDAPRERRLTRSAAPTDPDEDEAAGRLERCDPGTDGGGVHGTDATLYHMEKVRLGGMALANGVLVHGPSAWACAVRHADGTVKIASGRKRRFAPGVQAPFVRGPLRLAEALALLPELKRRLPEARLAFERPGVVAAMGLSSTVAAVIRRSGLPAGVREAIVAFASLVPAALTLRGGELAAYHGAEHVSIGSYEQDGPAAKEHDRCGSHLVGPLLVTSAAANALAGRAPSSTRTAARLAGALGAVGASVEVFGWMSRNPGHPVARALARPGHELQRRISTAEPNEAQLEVARAALAACLELEDVA
jgi:hypothetical protein